VPPKRKRKYGFIKWGYPCAERGFKGAEWLEYVAMRMRIGTHSSAGGNGVVVEQGCM
jgi:hypothetical protein